MLIPIEINGCRKWLRIVIRGVELKWFDDYGEFYTYMLEHAEIVEIVDEEKLIEEIKEYITRLKDCGNCTYQDLVNELVVQYGLSTKNAILLLNVAGIELKTMDAVRSLKLVAARITVK